MPERPYGGLVKIAHFQEIDADGADLSPFCAQLRLTPRYSSVLQPKFTLPLRWAWVGWS